MEHLYKGMDPTKGLSIEVTEQSLSEAENTYQKGILSDIGKKKKTNGRVVNPWVS